jgi:hypothetical protein
MDHIGLNGQVCIYKISRIGGVGQYPPNFGGSQIEMGGPHPLKKVGNIPLVRQIYLMPGYKSRGG